MLRLACLAVLLGGCTLWFDGGGDDEPPICAAEDFAGEPTIAPAPLRDPADLTCDSYGGGCDTRCGPCPAITHDLAPIPTYGYCGHACEGLGESQCAQDPECRVVKFADCVLGPNECITDFMGCFPTDTAQDSTIECHGADAWACSRSNACTALHSTAPCSPTSLDCERPFELCIPEGSYPGTCYGEVLCDAIPPGCPPSSIPGRQNGCWTGACIPVELCEDPPPPNK